MGDEDEALARHSAFEGHCLYEAFERLGYHGDCRYPHLLHCHAMHGDRRRTGASVADGHDHETPIFLDLRP
jgi:hypothetical protein